MISDDQYAGLCMTVKSLQKENADLLASVNSAPALRESLAECVAALAAIADDSRLAVDLDTGAKHYPVSVDEMSAIRRALSKARSLTP